MPRLTWDGDGDRYFETGVKNAVLYVKDSDGYGTGVAWNGITSITEKPSGAEANKLYADDMTYAVIRSAEEFQATLEAYTTPDAWAECDGLGTISTVPGLYIGQQARKSFGLAYRTQIGNDEEEEVGYKLHLIYGGTATPSEKAYQTINDSPEAITFSWEIDTVPVKITEVENFKPTSYICIDSRTVNAAKLTALENKLYGTDPASGSSGTGTDPELPTPDEVIELLSGN